MIKLSLKCAIILGLMLITVQAYAAQKIIINTSFESPYLSEDERILDIQGWSVFDTDVGIASHITNPSCYPLNQYEIDGRNVLIATGGEYVYQTLAATLAADTLYALTLDVGNVR